MPNFNSARMSTLATRELQENRNSLMYTPIGIALGLVVIMLISVLLANRVTVIGDTLLHVLLEEESAKGLDITIDLGGDKEGGAGGQVTYKVQEKEAPGDEQDWDFSEDWEFEPKTGPELQEKIQGGLDEKFENLNPVLNLVHGLMLVVLFLVSIGYLLSSLYTDRKDHSILFWRSMPLSEWEEVLSKLGVALLVVPAIFILASMVVQLAYVLIAMLMVWRMEMDPFQLILGNLEFGRLFFGQIAGWLLTILWIAPLYAWLLFASAAAKRSPFFLAIAPVLGIMFIEEVFLGSEYFANAIERHIPHYAEGEGSVGFFIDNPLWLSVDFVAIALGLVFAAVALTGAVYLRRYRFEI